MKQLLKQALDALEWAESLADTSDRSCQEAKFSIDKALKNLRQAIAQDEPVQPAYVPLTDKQIYAMHDKSCLNVLTFARAIERAVRGEKS